MKKNNNEYFCECGKELSKEEVRNGKTKCENCIGKKASKIKKILKGTTNVLVGIAGIAVFVATRGRKGKF